MVSAAVDAVDHRIGRPLEFIIEPPLDQSADDRSLHVFAGKHEAGCATFETGFSQAAMQALDDVTALAQLAQSGFGIVGNIPLAVTDLVRDAQWLERAQTADLEGME